MNVPIVSPKKLIEVALPLDAINVACAREKSIRHGHPSTMHLWWARRPLAAARAVLFAQLVNDPGYQVGTGYRYGRNKKDAAIERQRLFQIIEKLVLWENTNNAEVLAEAKEEIRRSWREVCELNKNHPDAAELFNPEMVPGVHDPFAGGGTIPLEAQRLGLDSFASDLNPVPVLLNKAMIEIPPCFAEAVPVGPVVGGALPLARQWPRSTGIAEDVRRYGAWIQKEALKRLGAFYPKIRVSKALVSKYPQLRELLDRELTPIAWLWARAVKSPNPAFAHVRVPLVSTFVLSAKEGREVFLRPRIERDSFSFEIANGVADDFEQAKEGTKLARANFRCILSGAPISAAYIKSEAKAGRMTDLLLAVIAEGPNGRLFLSSSDVESQSNVELPAAWSPELEISGSTQYVGVKPYGMEKFSDIFMPRQMLALTTFSDLVKEVHDKIEGDAVAAGMPVNEKSFADGGRGATAYADAISIYLALAVGRSANYWSSLTAWGGDFIVQTFGRQAYPIVWDHAEANPFSDSTGNWLGAIDWIARVIDNALPASGAGKAVQCDAQTQSISANKIVSTDPPYYDNVPYADLSDFFYIWLRRSLRDILPDHFASIAVPKKEELVAFAYRHEDGKLGAETFFLNGMTKAFNRVAEQAHPAMPVTIYYAFKQADSEDEKGTASKGWETFLTSLISAGFEITGTWPVRTERSGGFRNKARNSLASSIVLVCRKRHSEAPQISRRDYLRELNLVLPVALDEMTKGAGDDKSPVAPVDLSQAIIGPGISVFSKYKAVLEADGSEMSVKTALQLINRFLAEDDFDPDTQFCLHWFEQYGWADGEFGQADVLARSKSTGVDGLTEAGVVRSGNGKVQLLKWREYPADWNPITDRRTPIWEALHQLIRALKQEGESASGALLSLFREKSEAIRQLAYRLYTLCERQGWAEDARVYNELITSWGAIEAVVSAMPVNEPQMALFGEKL